MGILIVVKKGNCLCRKQIYIADRNPTLQRLLWVEFLVAKGPVGRLCPSLWPKVLWVDFA